MTSAVRAQDLPEIRAEISQKLMDPGFIRPLRDNWEKLSSISVNEMTTVLREMVDEATLYHVAAPMTGLVEAAANSLESFTPTEEDLPTPSGLMIFEGDLKQSLQFAEGASPLRGLIWGSANSEGAPVLVVLPIGDAHEGDPNPGALSAYPSLMFKTGYDENFDAPSKYPGPRSPQTVSLVALLFTAGLLMRQPLTEETVTEPDRATRKRLRRAGYEPAPVRVIELRRPQHASDEPGDGDREYHHQWIVRGHWRQHWYPKRQVHRPVWIAPHIKGPEGAPLIGGEKVYALKR